MTEFKDRQKKLFKQENLRNFVLSKKSFKLRLIEDENTRKNIKL